MTVKALPGSALEVIETKFFFQLLVSLLPKRRQVAAFFAKIASVMAPLAAGVVASPGPS